MSSTAVLPGAAERALPRVGIIAGVCCAALVIGAVSSLSATLALPLAAVPALALATTWLRGRLTWLGFLIPLGGLTLLGYGFANIPAFPTVPLPLADVLLVGTFLGLVLTGARWPTPGAPFVLAALLFAWASVRLLVDLPTWGVLAWRDFTTYVELSALFVGYWLMERIALERWIRALSWIYVGIVVYALTAFKSGIFASFNVVVGLQQPVSLLGHIPGVACVSAFFYFALVRPFGLWSYAVSAAAVPPLFVFQFRGLYLALPLALFLLALVGLARARTPRLRGLLAAVALAVVAGAIALTVQPAGRFGASSPALVRDQLSTIVGGTGVGSGTLSHRLSWLTETTDRVRAHPGAIVYGLGLGPDLTSGFAGGSLFLVRKPHDDYLEIFARLGLTGLILFVLSIGIAMRSIVSASRRSTSPVERGFLLWIFANSVIYLFISATQPLLAYPFGTVPLFGLLGAALALGRRRTDEAKP